MRFQVFVLVAMTLILIGIPVAYDACAGGNYCCCYTSDGKQCCAYVDDCSWGVPGCPCAY